MTVTKDAAVRAGWRESTIATATLHFHVVEAGPADGPLVVMLHGFPECWYAWRNYIDWCAGLGFHVVVPDQRGYNLSDKPAWRWNYQTRHLVADAIALFDALHAEQVIVIGHDWGGHVAWATAESHPERIARMAILNVAHPHVLVRNVFSNPRQILMSWYGLAFQVPWIPEQILQIADCAILRRNLRKRGVTDLSEEEARSYVTAWLQPGALPGMLNWYRGLVWALPLGRPRRITVPTLLLWGARDQFLDRVMAQQSIALCERGELVYFENGTHWLHHEEPAAVQQRIRQFLY